LKTTKRRSALEQILIASRSVKEGINHTPLTTEYRSTGLNIHSNITASCHTGSMVVTVLWDCSYSWK